MLEHVDDSAVWDLERHRTAARAIGALAGRWPADRVTAELGFRRRTLDELWHGKSSQFDIPGMADDEFWTHPALAGDDALRRDLATVIAITPDLIEALRDRPLALCHGDACPSNLLGAPDGDVIAIDWSYCSLGSIGSDLGQLLAGRFVDGSDDPTSIEAVATAIVDGHADGLRSEQARVEPDAIELAFIANLLQRATFDGLATVPDVPPPHAAGRIALARFAFDRALALAS